MDKHEFYKLLEAELIVYGLDEQEAEEMAEYLTERFDEEGHFSVFDDSDDLLLGKILYAD